MNPIILENLRDFDLKLYEPIHKRRLDLGEPLMPKAGNLVKVVTGMRRSGKSYRLFQEMQAIHERGIPWTRICYFNFEDDRLAPVGAATGDEVLEAFESINPKAFEEGAYLFFDELQEMADWGKWLRRIVDTKRVTIYATGSSSQMLSTEIATEFRGRAIDFELLPLSFAEYLSFNGICSGSLEPSPSSTERVALQGAFHDFLKQGGFPAIQGLSWQETVPMLQSYAQRVVANDVIDRHNIAHPRVVSLFSQRLLSMNARQLSLRKITGDLKAAGVRTSREYLGDILRYLEDAFLVFTMKERRYSLAESSNAMAKVYAIDPGLALANGRANTNDDGRRLEDAVFLELRRRAVGMRKEAITSLRTNGHGYEVDFALGDALDEHALELLQVCESVEDGKTLKRELRALWEALEEQRLERGVLIVADGVERRYEHEGKKIDQIPAWKWFAMSHNSIRYDAID